MGRDENIMEMNVLSVGSGSRFHEQTFRSKQNTKLISHNSDTKLQSLLDYYGGESRRLRVIAIFWREKRQRFFFNAVDWARWRRTRVHFLLTISYENGIDANCSTVQSWPIARPFCVGHLIQIRTTSAHLGQEDVYTWCGIVALVGAPFHIRQGQRFWFYVRKWQISDKKNIQELCKKKPSLANDPFSKWCALAVQRQHFCLASKTTRSSNIFWTKCDVRSSLHSNRVKFKRKIINHKTYHAEIRPSQAPNTSAHTLVHSPERKWRNKKVPNSHKSIFRTFLSHFISFS